MKTSMVMGAVTLIVIVVLAGVGWHLAHKKRPADTLVTIRNSVSAAPTNFELAAKLTGKDILKEEGVILKPTVVQAGGGGTVTMQALLGGTSTPPAVRFPSG